MPYLRPVSAWERDCESNSQKMKPALGPVPDGEEGWCPSRHVHRIWYLRQVLTKFGKTRTSAYKETGKRGCAPRTFPDSSLRIKKEPIPGFGRNVMTDRQRELVKAATLLLQSKGYTPAGRLRREVDGGQCGFEARLISTPSGGKPGWRV